jgi:hypothetical protein
LPRGSGIYVHTADKPGKFYYAVVSSAHGAQNTVDFSKENSLATAVEETPAALQPVLQGELPPRPYWNYREKRLQYVQWVAPPLGNLPSQYYNWSVGVPNDLGQKVPLELSLHRDGQSYYRTQYRIEQNSVVLSPYDFPLNTWWYGYHEAVGTLKSYQQGTIHNYTEQRLLASVDWACKKWPVDRNRILVTAMRGSGTSGALHLGLRHPEVFNLVIAGYGYPDYKAMIEADFANDRGRTPQVEKVLGRVEWDLKADTGKSVWDELNLTRIVKESSAKTDWPMVTMTGGRFSPSVRDFFVAFLDRGGCLMTDFGEWGGVALLGVTQTGNWGNMVYLDVAKNVGLPAFRGSEVDTLGTGRNGFKVPLNKELRWDTKDLVDEPGRLCITLRGEGRSGASGTLTLRRLQKFKVDPGKTYCWEFSVPKPAAKRGDPAVPQKGEITVGPSGLLAIAGLAISQTPGRLTIQSK